MQTWTPNPALYLSPEMVTELAIGQDSPLDVACKYGLSADEFTQLQNQGWFCELLIRRRTELAEHGITFAAKAKMMAEEMWQDIFRVSKTGDMRMEHRIDAAKQLTDIGGLRTRQDGVGANGPMFTINIQLPDNPAPPNPRNITPHDATPPPVVIDMTPEPQLPPKPPGFRVPDFKLTNDLTGFPQPAPALQPARAG